MATHSSILAPMNRGAWRAAVHGVIKSRARLKRLGGNAQRRTLRVREDPW